MKIQLQARLLTAAIISILFVSCGEKGKRFIPFSEDEYKVYSLVIDSLYYQEEIESTKKTSGINYLAHHYVLIDSTNSDSTRYDRELFASKGITSSDLISNFADKNIDRYSLKEYATKVTNIKLISLDVYQNYYRKYSKLNDGGMKGFTEFSKDYPHSFGTSVIQVTRVGFTDDKKFAVVGSMHLRGINLGYDYTFLEKKDHGWSIIKIINH